MKLIVKAYILSVIFYILCYSNVKSTKGNDYILS